jgi:hypothetical protein
MIKEEHLEIRFNEEYNQYSLYFYSNASYYYCINDCRGRTCYCKDKDWGQGTWDGLLLENSDYLLIMNLYNFIKENINLLIKLNRKNLSKWFNNNKDNFFNKYYGEMYTIMKIKNLYLFEIGFFRIDLYEKIKDEFEKDVMIKNKINLKNTKIENIWDNNNLCKKVYIGDIYLEFNIINFYNHNRIKSLSEISIEIIENILDTYNFLLNKDNFLFNISENILDNISLNLINKLNSKISKYFLIGPNISDLLWTFIRDSENTFDINYFSKKYNIDIEILNKYDNLYFDTSELNEKLEEKLYEYSHILNNF